MEERDGVSDFQKSLRWIITLILFPSSPFFLTRLVLFVFVFPQDTLVFFIVSPTAGSESLLHLSVGCYGCVHAAYPQLMQVQAHPAYVCSVWE